MARGKSEDKRNAIISAAMQVFADKGLGGPVVSITKAAGVAEGTLFTYFATKEELINAVYTEIKLDMADAMMNTFPRRASVKSRLRHIWNGYVGWGGANPIQHQVFKLISVWPGLTDEARAAGSASFSQVQTLWEDAGSQRMLRSIPKPFFGSAFNALAAMTIELIQHDPANAQDYIEAGFETLWAGVAKN